MTIDFNQHFEDHAVHYADRVAPLFDVTCRHVGAWAAALPAATRVLDVACGDGRVAATVSASGHEVIACDRSASLLRRAAHVRVRVLRADAHALPLQDGSVGAVVCNLGLQFFDRPVVALREMARVAGGGKPVLVTVPGTASGAPLPARLPVTDLLESAGLALVAEHTLADHARLHDVTTLLAVWRVELGHRRELAEASDEELTELAEVLLEREEGGVGVPLVFRAYHCTAG
ncbi:hypothetical protein BBK82_35530 [Lentzea guizhouensis]|uniref:Methyltransferase type 11 domain-containing protein n=1 Tax=Lentzea guizhouensis TaxID=1586287 RepID=A0A1B2HS51_9PSEU|nr:class I SAM-dependent methyltransferase [Lentzea guizhouensis]ANZ40531.1 hypothetical protein BBK82_35530 [Lentzea guizhouensis]